MGKQSLVHTAIFLEFVATNRVHEESLILLHAMRCSLYTSTLKIAKLKEICIMILVLFGTVETGSAAYVNLK